MPAFPCGRRGGSLHSPGTYPPGGAGGAMRRMSLTLDKGPKGCMKWSRLFIIKSGGINGIATQNPNIWHDHGDAGVTQCLDELKNRKLVGSESPEIVRDYNIQLSVACVSEH